MGFIVLSEFINYKLLVSKVEGMWSKGIGQLDVVKQVKDCTEIFGMH